MKNRNNLLLALLIGIVLLAFFYLARPNISTPGEPVPSQNEVSNATISLDFGDENQISKALPLDDNSTAFSLLNDLAQSESLDLETRQYDFGIFVKAITGYESSAEKAWIYYVNGESGQVAADQKKINSNDLVEWKYIEPDE